MTYPDFAVKVDVIDKFRFNEISNLRVINREVVYPAYRLIRYFPDAFAVFLFLSGLPNQLPNQLFCL